MCMRGYKESLLHLCCIVRGSIIYQAHIYNALKFDNSLDKEIKHHSLKGVRYVRDYDMDSMPETKIRIVCPRL